VNLEDYVKEGKLKVRVKPSAAKTEILGYDESHDVIKISVAAPPEDDKANIALLKFVKKQLGKQVKLHSGGTSRNKTLLVIE
jgi:uncharacterized protein (TIGR00251 family)